MKKFIQSVLGVLNKVSSSKNHSIRKTNFRKFVQPNRMKFRVPKSLRTAELQRQLGRSSYTASHFQVIQEKFPRAFNRHLGTYGR